MAASASASVCCGFVPPTLLAHRPKAKVVACSGTRSGIFATNQLTRLLSTASAVVTVMTSVGLTNGVLNSSLILASPKLGSGKISKKMLKRRYGKKIRL